MHKKKLYFFLLIFLNFIYINNSFAVEPYSFIQETADRASEALNKRQSKEEKMEKLKIIAKETVDIKGVGFYSLGSARKEINNDQKNTYLNLFENYFLKSFSSRLAEYSNPIINVDSKTKINENYTIVSSTLSATDKRPAVKIDWRVYTKNKDQPLIRDLIIEGLSLARTQKEEFNSIILSADGDINVLISKLKEFSNT